MFIDQMIKTGRKADTEEISLDAIRTDGGTQMRAKLDQATVDEYKDAFLEAGRMSFDPVELYYDGDAYWPGDGFHRIQACRWALAEDDTFPLTIPAVIHSGTRRDAVLHAAGANASHGLRRTNEDKRRAVMTLLNDDEWSKWSDREIARRCSVSNRFVSNLRNGLSVNGSQMQEERKVSRGGKTYTQNTSNIGKAAKTTYTQDEPPAPSSAPAERTKATSGPVTPAKATYTGERTDPQAQDDVSNGLDWTKPILDGVAAQVKDAMVTRGYDAGEPGGKVEYVTATIRRDVALVLIDAAHRGGLDSVMTWPDAEELFSALSAAVYGPA